MAQRVQLAGTERQRAGGACKLHPLSQGIRREILATSRKYVLPAVGFVAVYCNKCNRIMSGGRDKKVSVCSLRAAFKEMGYEAVHNVRKNGDPSTIAAAGML